MPARSCLQRSDGPSAIPAKPSPESLIRGTSYTRPTGFEQQVLSFGRRARATKPAGGARPRTEWLPESIACDSRGFVLTGEHVVEQASWPLDRAPLMLETSLPGVFAAGDIRHRSIKRVASAVGQGAAAVQQVHDHLTNERLRAGSRR
jgi:hypothetical protein